MKYLCKYFWAKSISISGKNAFSHSDAVPVAGNLQEKKEMECAVHTLVGCVGGKAANAFFFLISKKFITW